MSHDDLVARLRADPNDADAQAQLLLLCSKDRAHALRFAEGMATVTLGRNVFWSDVAALLRLETQSDEGSV